MAKKDTNETKPAEAAPQTAALIQAPKGAEASLSTPQAPTSTDLTPLSEACEKAKAGIAALLTTDLAPEVKAKVEILIDLANPEKLGVSEEMDLQWTVPKVMIVQPTSTSVEKPASAKLGDIFTSTSDILPQPFEFVLLYLYESNLMWEEGERRPVCSAPDAKMGQPLGLCANCKHLPMMKQKSNPQVPTDCHNHINAIVLDSKFENIYEISFSKTSWGAGRTLKNMAGRGKFGWEKSFQLETEKKVNDLKQTYYIYTVKPTGVATAPDFEKVARAMYHYVHANRKLVLAEYYSRGVAAYQAAAASEKQLSAEGRSALTAGLGNPGEGEEPIEMASAPTSSVRSNGSPM